MIYLASKSGARKKIFSLLGLKFKVLPSRAKELRRKGRLSFSRLTEKNALAKAEDVAKRVPAGVIVAADTIVVAGGRIFGKPKDLRHARKMLKYLSGRKQYLYTGIAVIDKDRKEKALACEKSKIYMDKLNDREISAYFAKVSPLDKAGSFDIQGRGAFFIRRIEGCYYNVVGLPLRKLYLIFKKLGVLAFVMMIFLAGCSTEYNIVTKQEESYYYSTDSEVQLGRAIAKEVAKEYKPAEDPLLQHRVETIGEKIASVSDRKDIDYYFMALQEDEVNAFALPGGYVYVNTGLVEKTANDDELACVLAHEVGHIVARHSIKKLQAVQGYSLLRILVAAAPEGGAVGGAADAAFTEIILGYSRDDEMLADELGARYAALAGYDPAAMITFLGRLQDISRRKPLGPMNYYKSHPYVPDRIRAVKQEMGEKIDFDDYINIEEQKGL